jgi:NAD(P)-dependent dehydrogenase (short-subunit alcohol dehydrogenase family)
VLEGQVVVVTGGGKGIGRHATKTFAQEKARVVIADFDPDWLESADREIGQVTETLAVKVDVRDEESVKNMVKQAVHHFGQSDVLIITKEAIRTFTRFVAEEPREANVCVVIVSPGVPIATKGAPPRKPCRAWRDRKSWAMALSLRRKRGWSKLVNEV